MLTYGVLQEMADEWVANISDDLGFGFAAYYPTGMRLCVLMCSACVSNASPGDVRGEIETFVARAGHVTVWHFDFMENFTFQISGRKTW